MSENFGAKPDQVLMLAVVLVLWC